MDGGDGADVPYLLASYLRRSSRTAENKEYHSSRISGAANNALSQSTDFQAVQPKLKIDSHLQNNKIVNKMELDTLFVL